MNEIRFLLAKLPNYQVHFSCSLTLDFKNPIRMQYKIKEPLKTVRLYLILSYHQSLSAWQEETVTFANQYPLLFVLAESLKSSAY